MAETSDVSMSEADSWQEQVEWRDTEIARLNEIVADARVRLDDRQERLDRADREVVRLRAELEAARESLRLVNDEGMKAW